MRHKKQFARLTTLVALCLSPIVSAEVVWHLNYEKGLEALRSQNYEDAIESLRSALEVNRAPASRVKLYGTRYIPYYPWFYLGKAYYELAESDENKSAEYYAESVDAFDVSEEYGDFGVVARRQGEIASNRCVKTVAVDNAVAVGINREVPECSNGHGFLSWSQQYL